MIVSIPDFCTLTFLISKTVMSPVFGVETFWYRQEFNKSRGIRKPHNLLYEAIKDSEYNQEISQSQNADKPLAS